ncbi:uncharacterized protein [Ptychodera flava]|uniref:uncharacterized protein isoform X2 n=1 Tax=Ptychodera flava TaxID=63121 RepID=UPI00396A0979
MSLVTCVTIAACLIWSAIGNQEDDFTNVRLSCHRASYMVPVEKHEIGYIYLGANYENVTARSLGECVTKCTKLDACESVNFWKHERICQMNEGTVAEMSEFTLWDGGVYRELASTQTDSLGGCRDNPCKNGATCHEICDGSSRYYECTCSVSYEGYDCETAKCYSPSVPSNAHISGSYSWPVASGTQIQILCNDWYNLAGSSTVTCTAGSWSATPSCTTVLPRAAKTITYPIPRSRPAATTTGTTCRTKVVYTIRVVGPGLGARGIILSDSGYRSTLAQPEWLHRWQRREEAMQTNGSRLTSYTTITLMVGLT